MEEYIDILTKEGKSTGRSASKSAIHRQGHYHNTGHLWLYNKNGEILLAQRAADKSLYPLLWDVSVAGHIDAGETVKQGLIRETKEEIGLDLFENDLILIGIYPLFVSYPNGIIDNEFHNTFIAELKVPLSSLDIQTEEVEAIKLVSMQEFKDLLDNSKNTNYFVDSNQEYYLNILDSIKKELNL